MMTVRRMQFKSLIRFPVDIRRARRLLAGKVPECSQTLPGRPVALDLRTCQLLFDCGRHLASLAHYARSAGSSFHFRCSPLLLAGIARKIHGREMLAEPHTVWVPSDKPLPDNALVLCDYPVFAGNRYVQMLIGRDIDTELPVMPYPMHPATLRELDHVDLSRLRNVIDRGGIFFAGNQKPKYGDAKMTRNFGVLSRLEILRTLADRFPNRVSSSIESLKKDDSIVLSDSRFETIAASDWLPTLARARFFVCCPGASQPLCHNLIEAMSVGTIPIIEYGDRVTPRLRDGENAICFRGQRELVNAMERIDRLSTAQVSEISQNTAKFYDRYLCGTRFLAALRDGRIQSRTRSVCMPFHELNFYASHRSDAA